MLVAADEPEPLMAAGDTWREMVQRGLSALVSVIDTEFANGAYAGGDRAMPGGCDLQRRDRDEKHVARVT